MDTYMINQFKEVVTVTGGRVSTDTHNRREATDLELEQQDEIRQLRAGIEAFVASFDNIQWGSDGDCGSQKIVSILEDL